MFKNNYLRFIFLWALCVACAFAQTQAARDTALVTTVSGAATWQAGQGGNANAVQSFMKLREADRIEIKAGARLQLVYLASGEVEQWQGPAAFVVGASNTQRIGSGTPVTRKLPMAMVERLALSPEVMSDLRNRSGVVVTRSLRSPKVMEAQRNYEEARRAQLPDDDITPELDLFLVLYQERQYQQANTVLQEMRRRAPDDLMVNELAERLDRALRQTEIGRAHV